MTARERLELIRAKCRPAHVSTMPAKPRHAGLIVRAQAKSTSYGIGPSVGPAGRAAAWVTQAEEQPAKEWKPRHRHDQHALTKIAEKWLHGPKTRATV